MKIMINICKIASMIGIALLMTSCGGRDIFCEQLQNATYFSDDFYIGSGTVHDPSSHYRPWHRRISITNTHYTRHRDDVGSVHLASCSNGEYIPDHADTQFVFSDDMGSLEVISGGESETFFRSRDSQLMGGSCREVNNLIQDRAFVPPEFANSDLEAMDLVKPPFVRFRGFPDGQRPAGETEVHTTVVYRFAGDEVSQGYTDCHTGEFHIHRDEEDTSPALVRVANGGETLTLVDGENILELVHYHGNEMFECGVPESAACGVTDRNMPCPTLGSGYCPGIYHQTYASHCEADFYHAAVVKDGPCGIAEGRPFPYGDPDSCIPGTSVCAAVASSGACPTLPCPDLVHQDFNSECLADAAQAPLVAREECGDLLGEPVTELLDTCPDVYQPVCGKRLIDSEFQYQTFQNICMANVAFANTAFVGECADLEGRQASGAPPVQLVDELPSVEKPIEIMGSSIAGDILTLEFSYSSCEEQYFEFQALSDLNKNDSRSLEFALKASIKDTCDASFSTTIDYDLLPVKYLYRATYDTYSGEIQLPGIGVYQF